MCKVLPSPSTAFDVRVNQNGPLSAEVPAGFGLAPNETKAVAVAVQTKGASYQ